MALLGYAREEYVGPNIAEFHADSPVIEDILCKLTNRERLSGYEARLRCKEGSIKDVLIDSSVLWDVGRWIMREGMENRRNAQALRRCFVVHQLQRHRICRIYRSIVSGEQIKIRIGAAIMASKNDKVGQAGSGSIDTSGMKVISANPGGPELPIPEVPDVPPNNPAPTPKPPMPGPTSPKPPTPTV